MSLCQCSKLLNNQGLPMINCWWAPKTCIFIRIYAETLFVADEHSRNFSHFCFFIIRQQGHGYETWPLGNKCAWHIMKCLQLKEIISVLKMRSIYPGKERADKSLTDFLTLTLRPLSFITTGVKKIKISFWSTSRETVEH